MTAALRLLVVEDSAYDASLLVQALERAGRIVEYERVDTAVTMHAALAARPWDFVTAEWSLPQFSGPAALVVLKETGHGVPFIVVSGSMDVASAIEAMRLGADDCVFKNELGRLAPAVERALRECSARKALVDAQVALRASEARFNRLADSGIIGITIADVRGNIVDANDTYLRMTGFSRPSYTLALFGGPT